MTAKSNPPPPEIQLNNNTCIVWLAVFRGGNHRVSVEKGQHREKKGFLNVASLVYCCEMKCDVRYTFLLSCRNLPPVSPLLLSTFFVLIPSIPFFFRSPSLDPPSLSPSFMTFSSFSFYISAFFLSVLFSRFPPEADLSKQKLEALVFLLRFSILPFLLTRIRSPSFSPRLGRWRKLI